MLKSPKTLIVLLVIVIFSCQKDDMKSYNIEVKGIVTDNTNGQPVSAASIYSSVQRSGIPGNSTADGTNSLT